MKFGVFDHMDDAGVPLGQLYADRLAFAEACDRAGIWGYILPSTIRRRSDARLRPGLSRRARPAHEEAALRSPGLPPRRSIIRCGLIEEICMLDQMSGGRLLLGVGRGVSPFETRHYGLDFASRGEMYHEAYELLLKGLAADELTFEGKYYHSDKVPMDPQTGAAPAPAALVRHHPPGECRLAGGQRCEHRDHLAAPHRAHNHRRAIARPGKGSASRLTRCRSWGVSRHVVVADTDEQALGDCAPRLSALARQASAGCSSATTPSRASPASIPSPSTSLRAVDNGIAGSPKTVRDFIASRDRGDWRELHAVVVCLSAT